MGGSKSRYRDAEEPLAMYVTLILDIQTRTNNPDRQTLVPKKIELRRNSKICIDT